MKVVSARDDVEATVRENVENSTKSIRRSFMKLSLYSASQGMTVKTKVIIQTFAFPTSINSKLPKNKPIRKLNLYLGYPPAKRADPIR
ncbi:hypothetical protein N8146_09920, partial [Ascidiaceihabitans sp.]|nr:hypothetical protein [Ascidiaceihabitans sp.]